MPIIKSARKRAKQTKVRTARNQITKRKIKTEIKAVSVAVDAGNGADAQEALARAHSALDTAVKKNLIHKNKAARKKAQLHKAVKSVAGSKPTAKKKTAAKKPAAKKPAAKKSTTTAKKKSTSSK